MPSIPRFQVRQEDDWIFIEVYVPYVRVSEMEFHVDGVNFSFYCKPYLLKLQFPHEVVDDDRTKAVYDPSRVSYLNRTL
jgi:protein SHQ1